MSAFVCPKCSYARTAADTAPAWQCPSCGIAYNKFQASPGGAQQVKPGAGVPMDNRKKVGGRHRGNNESASTLGLGYFALLLIGIFLPFENIWLWVLPVMTVIAFRFWLVSLRTKRAILDAPTSKVNSAAQGYVELHGKAEYVPGCTLKTPLTSSPCVWYQYSIVERAGRKNSRTLEGQEYGTPFLLRDETGDCLVDPNEALVICDTCDQWVSGELTHSEWSIRVGDPVYAIGWFSSNALHDRGELNKETTVRLRSWLRDPKRFFGRFDANRDGKVSAAELAAAREAAHREAAQYYAAQGGMHTLTAPENKAPYIVSNLAHDQVAGEFGAMTHAHLWIFFITLGFLAYNLFY